MTAELLEPISATPAPAPATTARSPRFAACLRRCAAAGIRLLVTTPADPRTFQQGVNRFPERRIQPDVHAQWDAAYRNFSRRARLPHDRGSWRILALDHDDHVIGAITARFFCGDFVADYLHMSSLLDTTGPVLREHCEIAVAEVFAVAAATRRTAAEVSNWSVAPGWHAALVAVTLSRAMGALVGAFDAPLVILAADNRRGEVARLMRQGCAPLGVAGRYALPPFVHHTTGAWVRLLLVDAATFHARANSRPGADLALLRTRAPFVSVA